MGMFDRFQKQNETEKFEETGESKPWENAKIISIKEADDPDLEIGWYVFQYGSLWYGLKPDPYDPQYMIDSDPADYPEDLEEWLGVPVATPEPKPEEAPKKKRGLESQIGSAQKKQKAQGQTPVAGHSVGYNSPPQQFESSKKTEIKTPEIVNPRPEDPMNRPATDVEKRWTEAEAIEELEDLEQEIQDAERLVTGNFSSENSTDSKGKNEKKRGRKTLGRTNRLQFRVTDEELARLQKRVEKSGLTQGEFLRNEVLYGAIYVQEDPFSQPKLMSDLALMCADVGRMGGLLKMVVRPNEGQREFFEEDWEALQKAINEVETIKQRLMKLEKSVGECIQNSKGNIPKSGKK